MSKLSDGQTPLDGRKHGLDCGRLEQARLLPFTDPDFAQCRCWSELTGNSHQHYVRTGGIVGEPADNDSWPLLGCALVSEWEWNEEDGTEVKGHRTRRLPDYSRRQQTLLRWRQLHRGQALAAVPASG
jgi:hypothetical protein